MAQLNGRLQQCLGKPSKAAFEQAMADAPLAGVTVLQSMIALDHACTLPADEALAVCEHVIQRSDALGLSGVALAARVRAALFAARVDVQRASAFARQVLESPDDIHPDDLYRAERWLNAATAFHAADLKHEARAAAITGRDWVLRMAHEHVPVEFRDSFLHRNPVNRELLALAARVA